MKRLREAVHASVNYTPHRVRRQTEIAKSKTRCVVPFSNLASRRAMCYYCAVSCGV
jgi:hypothetical protein